MRLFVGLPWPAEAGDLAQRVGVWDGRTALRPVRRENWHVTLRFLGDSTPEQVTVLTDVLKTWSQGQKALTFIDRGWGCFGSFAAPRVVVLKLEAMPGVQKAVVNLQKALDGAGFPGDGKAWKPHLTIAYGRGGDPGPWPSEALGGRLPILFDKAVLYDSELGEGGSTYRELAAFPLG